MGQTHQQTTDTSTDAATTGGQTAPQTAGQTGHGNAAALADMAATQTGGNTVPRGGQPYTIVRGDTLSGIARRTYGRARYWQDIMRANPDKCHRGGSLIHVDVVLNLPVIQVPEDQASPGPSAADTAQGDTEPDGGTCPAVPLTVVEQVLGVDDMVSAPRDYDGIFSNLLMLTDADRNAVLTEMRRRGMWEPFLDSLQAGDVAIIQTWLPAQEGQDGNYTLEERIDQSHNSARGRAALAAVDAQAATDTNVPPRITERLRELLSLGVGMPRVAGDDLASEGYLGVHQATRAAQALIAMPPDEYMRTVMLLTMTGSAQLEQSFVLLEAIAARLDRYTDADASNDSLQDVDQFADDIRGMDAQTLSDQTTVAQTATQGTGLTQRYTMSCNVTSAVVVRNEADPVEALATHQSNQLGITQLEGGIAAETESTLENHGGNVAVARNTSGVTGAVNTAITALTGTAPAAELTAVSDYLAGRPFNAANYAAGIIKVRNQIGRDGFPDAQAVRLVRETAIGGSQPGIGPTALANEWNGALNVDEPSGQTAAVDWDAGLWALYTADNNGDGVADRVIPSPLPATWTTPISGMLNRAAPKLENGQDVAFNVYWNGGGGHTMTFTNVRGAGAARSFLVHDTWTGNTTWVTQANILAATWPGISGNTGLLCGVIG